MSVMRRLFGGNHPGGQSQLVPAIGSLAILTLVGTLGFISLEDLPWVDALYLAVVTISTVGYGDFVPQTPHGRLFAIGLIVTGVGAALYLISVVAKEILEGHLADLFERSSMMRRISHLDGHVIVCGYGRFGCVVVEELRGAGRQVVVIESDPERERELREAGLEYVIGSAATDEALEAAGVDRAEALVVATSLEAESVFVTLSARDLSPALRIHARGESQSAVRRLKRAGADFVTSPYQMGGQRAAASILRPSVVDFLELSHAHRRDAIDLEEIRTSPGSDLVGIRIADLEAHHPKLRVVALQREAGDFELVPSPEDQIGAGDHLVVIGEREQLDAVSHRALPGNA